MDLTVGGYVGREPPPGAPTNSGRMELFRIHSVMSVSTVFGILSILPRTYYH